MRFHVLGVGSIGTLVAHHLRLIRPTSPISLVTKSGSHVPSTRLYPYGVESRPRPVLRVERDRLVSTSTGYEIEKWHDGTAERRMQVQGYLPPIRPGHSEPEAHPPNGEIKSLIVCLKTNTTVEALAMLRPRISPSSVITLIQNGMGVYDELCASLWPDPKTRPQFIIGTTTHGVKHAERNDHLMGIIHANLPGHGEMRYGVVADPRRETNLERWIWGRPVGSEPILAPPPTPPMPLPPIPETPRDLTPLKETIEALMAMTPLSPSLLPMPHLHHQQLLKLAINSVINPITAILGAGALPNGSFVDSPPAHKLIRQLVGEVSKLINVYLGSLAAPHAPAPDIVRLFSKESIERRVLAVARATATNHSSMASDVARGRMTEIQHINGYLLALAKRLDVPMPRHSMIVHMVKFTAEVSGLSPVLPSHIGPLLNAKREQLVRAGTVVPRSIKQVEVMERELDLKERMMLQKEDEKVAQKSAKAAERAEKRAAEKARRIARITEKSKDKTTRTADRIVKSTSVVHHTETSADDNEKRAESITSSTEDGTSSTDDRASSMDDSSASTADEVTMSTERDIKRTRNYEDKRERLNIELNDAMAFFAKEARDRGERLQRPTLRKDKQAMVQQYKAILEAAARKLTTEEPQREEPIFADKGERSTFVAKLQRLAKSTGISTARPMFKSESVTKPKLVEKPKLIAKSKPVTEQAAVVESTPAAVSEPSTSPASPTVGSAEWMNQMIAAAPRQERTWDVPSTPPTARGPLPKKRETQSEASWTAGSISPTPVDTPISTYVRANKETSSEQPADAPPTSPVSTTSTTSKPPAWSVSPPATAPSPHSSTTSPPPTRPLLTSIDSLISSAPRAQRSWEEKGGTITGYTSPAPSLASVVGTARQGTDLARGGIGSALDGLIASSPRIERTWDVPAARVGGKDKGRFSTSRSSGS